MIRHSLRSVLGDIPMRSNKVRRDFTCGPAMATTSLLTAESFATHVPVSYCFELARENALHRIAASRCIVGVAKDSSASYSVAMGASGCDGSVFHSSDAITQRRETDNLGLADRVRDGKPPWGRANTEMSITRNQLAAAQDSF